MAKSKVFLDSSVIIAALLSSSGGSFYIINTLNKNLELQTNKYVLREVEKAVRTKFENNPELLLSMSLFIEISLASILKNPTTIEKNFFSKFISIKDAPILASAIKHSDYLLTLDNEFFGKKILELAKKKSLTILKPKELIETLRTNTLS